jgi:hypothetical protein
MIVDDSFPFRIRYTGDYVYKYVLVVESTVDDTTWFYLLSGVLVDNEGVLSYVVLDLTPIRLKEEAYLYNLMTSNNGNKLYAVGTGRRVYELILGVEGIFAKYSSTYFYKSNVFSSTIMDETMSSNDFIVPVGFRDIGSYGVNSKVWDFNNGSISSYGEPVTYYNWSGKYIVDLVVNSSVSKKEVSKTINIGNNLFIYNLFNRLGVSKYGKSGNGEYKRGFGGDIKVASDEFISVISNYTYPLKSDSYVMCGEISVILLNYDNWALDTVVLKRDGISVSNSVGNFTFSTDDTLSTYEIEAYFSR